MKYLFNNGKIALGVIGDEWRIGKPAKDEKGKDTVLNPSYYYREDIAVRHLAKKVSNAEAADLWEWISMFNEICEGLKAELSPDTKN